MTLQDIPYMCHAPSVAPEANATFLTDFEAMNLLCGHCNWDCRAHVLEATLKPIVALKPGIVHVSPLERSGDMVQFWPAPKVKQTRRPRPKASRSSLASSGHVAIVDSALEDADGP
eukprot:2904746-Amphidinium_carterae.1